MADEQREPWHEVAVTVTWFHHLTDKPSGGPKNYCDGHESVGAACSADRIDAIHCEVERELIHPPECEDVRKPCGNCWTCFKGDTEHCPDTYYPWRCGAEQELYEYGDEYDELQQSGRYRVQAWWSRDYWGEYDCGMEIEDAP